MTGKNLDFPKASRHRPLKAFTCHLTTHAKNTKYRKKAQLSKPRSRINVYKNDKATIVEYVAIKRVRPIGPSAGLSVPHNAPKMNAKRGA